MLVLDELKKSDPQLRLVALALAGGLCILLTGLWWVQIVSAREYQGHLETQTTRTVRLPAVRGKILDREGRVLAENRPRYDLSIYLDDLRNQFQSEYARLRPVKIVKTPRPFWEFWSKSGTVVTQRARLNTAQLDALTWQARYNVASTIVSQVSRKLGQPLALDPVKFKHDLETRLAMPYTIVANATPEQVARFEEQFSGNLGADVDLQSVREYPYGILAGHLLGYLSRNDDSKEGEDAYFNYYLPDYVGVTGVEGGYDSVLRGHAGGESVLVNNMGYRQSETVLEAPEPGNNVVLTIDYDLQQVATRSLLDHQGPDARGAVVVMDVRTGDVLAMVSSPEINPDYPANDPALLADTNLLVQFNRATQMPLAPGSIFKPVIGLAALENGLDPNVKIYNPEDPENPGHGYYKFSASFRKKDTALPGYYDFTRAIEMSCNTYFITVGLQNAGKENIVRLARKFHFGERIGLPTGQETRGNFPTLEQVNGRNWRDGNTADVCIGQEIDVTPMQIAVAYAAIANGGTILMPRLVEKIEDPVSGGTLTNYPSGLVRDHIGVNARSLRTLREAMLSETEDPEGTGQKAVVGPEMRICGKTGTAQVKDVHGQLTSYNFWFASFAPYENPKYVVVVMVQSSYLHGSGGLVCAPIAHDIYEEILKKEHPGARANTARN